MSDVRSQVPGYDERRSGREAWTWASEARAGVSDLARPSSGRAWRSRRSNSTPWPIRCGAPRNRSAPIWRKASPSSGGHRRNTGGLFTMAIGSADEMRVWLRYCRDLGYIDEPTWLRWRDEYQQIARMLTGLHEACAEPAGKRRRCRLGSAVLSSDIWMVAERSVSRGRRGASLAGGIGSAEGDMSSDKAGEKPARRKSEGFLRKANPRRVSRPLR